MIEGVIIKGVSGTYNVDTENGAFLCKPKGLFRLKGITPLIGDKVSIDITDKDLMEGVIVSVKERINELPRPRVANVDQTCIVFSVSDPVVDLLLLDKIILASSYLGIDTLLCLNKVDLDTKNERKSILLEYSKAGFEIVIVSSAHDSGLESLTSCLKDKITVFAGQSGAGKSSLINQLSNGKKMQTGGLSAKNNRGKHTTRHAELLQLSVGGYIIDTPGFSNLNVGDIRYDELNHYYPEYVKLAENCRFKGCVHINEPDCAVKKAIEKEDLGKNRYDRYVQIYDILKENDANKYK